MADLTPSANYKMLAKRPPSRLDLVSKVVDLVTGQ